MAAACPPRSGRAGPRRTNLPEVRHRRHSGPESGHHPAERPEPATRTADPAAARTRIRYPRVGDEPPLGFTGSSSVLPRSGNNAEYETVEDCWRLGFPFWDRYGQGFPRGLDYPYKLGRIEDPYNQNVLKGDYPIIGQHTFLVFTATTTALAEARTIPTATTPFESTTREGEIDFFGHSGQLLFNDFLAFSVDVFQGDAAFKPADWRVKLTPAFNFQRLAVQELGVINPDVRKGRIRDRGWSTLQEWFGEVKLADLSPEYDFVSIRAGSQPFTSDFRGFIFSDTNAAVRVFGTLNGNRDQFNAAIFRQLEKDTKRGLNSFQFRNQTVAVLNYYRQDFIFPGYTAEASVHYNEDGPDFLFDRNQFLVRRTRPGCFSRTASRPSTSAWPGTGTSTGTTSRMLSTGPSAGQQQPLAGRSQTIMREDGGPQLSYTTATGPISVEWVLRLWRQEHQRRPGDRVRHDPRQPELCRWRVRLLAAANPAGAKHLAAEQPDPGPAVEQDPGAEQAS